MSGEGVKTEEEKAAEARRGPGANAAQRRGPMSMGMPTEKSQNFVPSAKRLLSLLRPERAAAVCRAGTGRGQRRPQRRGTQDPRQGDRPHLRGFRRQAAAADRDP